ncbi:hypothetical protein FRC06_003706 [Ceratobasidium sp. 370]|nr:hypothetical protein FRC06_003706 [Ceratobasidium sp. 370]
MDDGKDEVLGEDNNILQDRDGSKGSHSMPSKVGVHAPSDMDMMSVGQRDSKDLQSNQSSNQSIGTPIQLADPDELHKRHCNHTDVRPFTNEELFKLVDIVLMLGMSGKKRDRFLKLTQVGGGTPWKNKREMLLDIDQFILCGPKWWVKTFQVTSSKGSKHANFWFRDGLDGILHLLAEPQFMNDMEYKPTKVYVDLECQTHTYSEMTSADRMWSLQNVINDDRATVVPTFFVLDKTALMVFVHEQKAHPVYLTIGNLAKGVQHQVSKWGMILVGYLPVTKLECEPNDEKRCILKWKLFHECMREVTAHMGEACKQGTEALCSDRGVRRIYPMFCGSMLDFAEQCKYTWTWQLVCPTCEVPAKEQGNLTNYPGRNHEDILVAMRKEEVNGPARFEDLG